ncbi:DivIVA domain-containing protein [Nocardia gipuzkoensis]|uniref:DivIVA domain-containing protein n=1 Tax=Nocardia gipuzkoensis TaxID=2749991 RepID=UPI00237E26B0|nr:DivIVA domain-containing protein [Nocardia gipuzkoensis]MDE1675433.1 DivIVA domain-containing protein [Nocardia gipuzkoensis]
MALKAHDIGNTRFKKSALGRRGYDEREVDEFVGRVSREISLLNSMNKRLSLQLDFSDEKALLADNDYLAHQVAELERRVSMYKSALGDATTVEYLRTKVAELERENAQLREDAQRDVLGVNVRAVNILSQAQITAESTVAEAEIYARELVAQAREQYAEILQQAQKSAARAADGIAAVAATSEGTPEPLPAEIEYIRTYAQIAEKQMHTIVEALFTEIDKLGSEPSRPHRDAEPTGYEVDVSRSITSAMAQISRLTRQDALESAEQSQAQHSGGDS